MRFTNGRFIGAHIGPAAAMRLMMRRPVARKKRHPRRASFATEAPSKGGQELKKQKPRSPGEEKRGLAKKRMAFRDKVHCETYSSGTQEPDPEHVAAANDRLTNRSTGTSLPGGYRDLK